MREDITEDWIECSVGDVVVLMKNGSSVSQYNDEVGFPISRIETISDGKIDFARVKYIRESNKEIIEKHGILKDDILFSHINSDYHLGKTAIYKNNRILIHGINLLLLRISGHVSADFINYQFIYLRTQGKFIEVAQRAVNQSSINQRKLKGIQLRLAPLPEQRAIVKKIEELLSELDNGISNLNKAKEKLEIYRQAVLKKAFEGELTKEWRETQDDLTSGEETLAQIERYRNKSYDIQMDKWREYVKQWELEGAIGKKPTKPSQVDVSVFNEYKINFYTPSEWTRCQLADVLFGLTDYHANGSYEILKENVTLLDQPDYALLIRATNFEKNDFSDDLKYINEHSYNFLSKTRLYGGEILIGKIGNAGKVYLMPALKQKASLAMNLFAIKVDQKYIISKFLYYQLKNFYQEKEISSYVKGVGNPTIDKISIRSIHVNLCSVKEQIRIVQEIEARLSLCDNILISINEALDKAKALRQSILKKAFEGKLLSEDEIEDCRREPDWEPAEKILEKIKNELRSAK